MTAKKLCASIADQVGDLTPEETAKLAGMILEQAGINRDTVQVFLQELTADDRVELAAQVEALIEEEANG